MWSDRHGFGGANRFTRRQLIRTGAVAGAGYAMSAPAGAQPADLVVAADGSGDYTTIQPAIDALDPGGTIHVEPGTYAAEVLIDKPLTLLGDPGSTTDAGPGPDAPVLDGDNAEETSAVSLHQGVADVTIAGFDIRHWGSATADGSGVSGDQNDHVTVRDCRLTDVTRGIIGFDGHDWTVRRNHLEKPSIHGVHLVNTSNATIADNVVQGGVATRDSVVATHQPIKVTADGRFGVGSRCAAIAITGNEVKGRFQGPVDLGGDTVHGSGIFLLAINDAGAAPEAVIEDVSITDNLVETNPQYSPRLAMGFRLAANPLDGGAVQITDVTLEDNVCDGPRTAYPADTRWASGLHDITYRGNVAEDAETGFRLGVQPAGSVETLRYEGNHVVGSGTGMSLNARGTLSALTVVANTLVENEHGGITLRVPDGGTATDVTLEGNRVADNDFIGIHTTVHGHLQGATYEANEVRENLAGLRFTGGGSLAAVEVTENTLAANETGDEPPGAGLALIDLTGTPEIHAHQNRIVENGVGVGAIRSSTDDVVVSRNDILDNDLEGARCFQSSAPLLAQCNYWGHASGPTHDGNRGGHGDGIAGDVDADPWLPRPFADIPEQACRVHRGRSGSAPHGHGE